ncbi:major facilitator superfamily domain-containing protein [Lanmaoa asiatica]|nr:major facilitator superfamily domain-containing protein [Lanmaoa asiatica]
MSETTLLLGETRSASPSRERFRLSPETLLIPVALATKLATLIPTTTLVELIRRAVCMLWNISHGDPATFPAGGPIPPELCDVPEIERYYATVIAIFSATEGILSIAGCGILSRISSHYGRKPALLLLLTTGIMASCLISGSQYTPDWLTHWTFLAGVLLAQSSGPFLYAYLVNMYIVDVCAPEARTAALSKIAGWTALGACISFAMGGIVTTKTGNPLIVFYIAAAIFAATLIYVVSVLPESFPEEKRNALSRMGPELVIDGLPTTSFLIFEPLKMLIPTRKLDGSRNWRLAWCATHTFVFMAADTYAAPAWLVLATSKYHLTPTDTGLFFTIVTVSSTIVLAVIVPQLVRVLSPYYNRRIKYSLPMQEYISNGEELELETSDRLDVHLAFVSCVIAGISYLSAAASTTNQALIFCKGSSNDVRLFTDIYIYIFTNAAGICIGFTTIHAPTVRSLVAGSVDPLKQGEALAAIEMVSNAANALSPIIMGSILTASINTTPLLLFYIHLIVVLISSALLFLIRGVDRYQGPHEA